MAKLFTKNDPVWADEVLASDPLYNILQSDNTPINSNVKIELATEVGTAGTSLTAARMNNVETGLDAVDTKLSLLSSITQTATAAGTTTLTAASNRVQEFTGTTTQTVVMPDVTTLTLGDLFTIVNSSTGILTVNSSGANLIKSVQPGATCQLICVAITGTTAASWKTLSFDPAIAIAAAVSKTTPIDADKFGFWDSVTSLLNQVTWANIKATLLSYFNTVTAYASYNPTLTGITIGAGTVSAGYATHGNTIDGYVEITFAADTAITGTCYVSLPVAEDGIVRTPIGIVTFLDSGSAQYAGVGVISSGKFQIKCLKVDATYATQAELSSTVPFTWAVNDQIILTFQYVK